MQLIQTVAPVKEPLSLLEVKEFLRVLDDDSDALINSLIISVREHIENVTNRQLEVATFEMTTSDFVSKLPKSSIKSVSKVEYMGLDGVYIALPDSTYYLYDRYGIGYISYSEIPLIKEHKKAVKITFVCGYDIVPEAIKQYMKVKISTLFENREQFVVGVSISEFGGEFIESLLLPYKIKSI